MAIRDNIRRRRQERIETILTRSQHEPLMKEKHGGPLDIEKLDRMDDPEYVWKMKHQQWQRELEHDDDGFKQRSMMGLFHYLSWRQLRYQFAFAMLVFMLVWGMLQLDHPWAEKGQAFIDRALTQPFEYETIAKWYGQFFQGTPSFIPAFHREDEAKKVNAFD